MALPVAAIVCIVLACWVVIVLLLFGLYKFLKYRGSCDCECSPCGQEGGENTCCKSLSESCNCCNPSLQGCLNSACPKKKISCVDIILCQCCAEPGQESCLVNISQYIFCCPCKTFAECCLERDKDYNWVTKWRVQDQSFCQWMCSGVNCDTNEVKAFTCQSPKCECWHCSSFCCCQHFHCSKDCCKQESNCRCLDIIREQIGSMWSKVIDISCCKCAKDSCKCSGEKFACLKFNRNSFSCLKCSGEQPQCCNLDKCNFNSCFLNYTICSQPTKCPTYEVEISTRMKGVSVCPFCPANILCFSCNETEAIRCCCHYVFLNRCGDPSFSYNDRKVICTWNTSSCCSFLFELFVWFCQTLCVGCFTVCENSLKCCGYSCLASLQLLTCQCSEADFCSKFSCLCFDFDKFEIQSNEMDTTESELTKCGCFVLKNEPIREQPSSELVILESNSLRMFTLPGGSRFPIPDSMSDSTFRKHYPDLVIEHSGPAIAHSLPNFKQANVLDRKVHNTESLPSRRSISCDLKDRESYYNQDDEDGFSSRTKTNQHRLRKAKYDDYTSEESLDREEQSYQDVRNMERLQKQLLSKQSHYVEDETDGDFVSRQGNRRKNRIHTAGSSASQMKSSKIDSAVSPSGILKTHSKYFDDQDSDFDSTKVENIGEMKHAHFEDEDPELYRELFPLTHNKDVERRMARQAALSRKHKNRRKQLRRQKCVDGSMELEDISSDEPDRTVGVKIGNRLSLRRDLSSSDDDRYTKSHTSSSGINRSREGLDRFNMREEQVDTRDKNQRRRKRSSRHRFEISDERKTDSSSDDEIPNRQYRSKTSCGSGNGYERSPRHSNGNDRKALCNEEEDAIGSAGTSEMSMCRMGTSSKKKSVSERLREIRERSARSDSNESSEWV